VDIEKNLLDPQTSQDLRYNTMTHRKLVFVWNRQLAHAESVAIAIKTRKNGV
jgi:hypothetical protein